MSKPHGVGTENVGNGELIYKGPFYEGKRHGKGEIVWRNGDMYHGEFRNGKKHG